MITRDWTERLSKRAYYKNYLLVVLVAILALNSADTCVVGLVLQNIKVDLSLSDTQLGFLTGIAFALFNSVMGIPIARWADRGSRVTVIASITALWGVMMALCGLTASFVQLLLCRVGVAVAEAGSIPPPLSLISDYFPRTERPRAAAIYWLGPPLGVVIGYFAAGWVNELYGWRAAFLMLGLPGLALTALAWLTLKEPRRERSTAEPTEARAAHPSLKEVLLTLWASVTFRRFVFSYSVLGVVGFGIAQWQSAFFIRSFGLKTGELGTWFAAIFGLGGLLGTYWGGALTSRYAANNERLQIKGIAAAMLIYGVVTAFSFLVTNHYLAFGLTALANVAAAATNGPLYSTLQMLVPQRMRATAIAVFSLFNVLIGTGLGPLAVGVLSDALRPLAGEESLRYALVAMCPGYLWFGWHLWQATETVTRDLETVQEGYDVVKEGDDGVSVRSVSW